MEAATAVNSDFAGKNGNKKPLRRYQYVISHDCVRTGILPGPSFGRSILAATSHPGDWKFYRDIGKKNE